MNKPFLEEQPKQFLLPLDIQFFADGTHPFAETPTPSEPHPYAADASESSFAKFTDQPNPLEASDDLVPEIQPQSQGLDEQPPQPTPEDEGEFLDFSGRKVKVVDPVIHDLHKDYMELNSTFQRTNQELQQQRQLNEGFQALQQQQQAAQQQIQPPENLQAAGPSPERIAQLNEEYMERMYESKFEADKWWQEQPEVQELERQRLGVNNIDELVNQKVNEIVGPIQQEREVQRQITELREKFQDFDEVTPKIQELLNESPELANMPNAIENMYYLAKGRTAETAPTPESLLSDPRFQEQIVQNEQVRNMVLENYQKSKLAQNQQIPTVIGNMPGQQTPISTGDKTPKTLAEASEAFARFIGQK